MYAAAHCAAAWSSGILGAACSDASPAGATLLGMDESIQELLKQSHRLDADIGALFEEAGPPPSRRALLTMAMCQVAMEHGASQRLLIEAGCHVTALALVRLHFEAVVRAIWLHHGASEEWLERFSAPTAPQQLAEPVLGPPVDAMLQRIDATAPPFVGKMLRDLKTATWAPMNSYVHGGVRAVVQALAGCPPSQLDSVLRNGNGLALLTANVFVITSGDGRFVGRIAHIQAAHRACLPPH